MKKTLQLQGLDCAGCAAELEELISEIEGISSVSVVFMTQKLTLEYESEAALERAIDTANTFEEVRVVYSLRSGKPERAECSCEHCHGLHEYEHNHEHKHNHEHEHSHECEHHEDLPQGQESHRKEWLTIISSGILLLAAMLLQTFAGGTFWKVVYGVCFVAAYCLVGYPVILSTLKNLSKGRIFDENFLMTIASVGAMLIGETSEGVLVMLLYQIGELLQAIAVGSSRRSVSELMKLKSEWATLVTEDGPKQVKPEELKIGDIVLVKKGERVPVDGILLGEEGVLDTKSLTGESEYKIVKKGEEILSGCINEGGMYEMSVLRLYQDSAAARVLDMVENAASGKAKPEKFITKFAKYYTPIVCCLALAVALLAPLASGVIAGEGLYFKDWTRWVQSALTFLVISCPCALIISVPLTYFSGIGACAKLGALVKGATHLDVLSRAKIAAFDKTGTLTEGRFEICAAVPTADVGETELLALASAAERASAHPIARAFSETPTPYTAERVQEQIGRGLAAIIENRQVLVGTSALLRENGVSMTSVSSSNTVIYVARDGEYLGYIEIGDKLREESTAAIASLRELGVERTVMLTGDSAERARSVAERCGIDEVRAELLPDQKLSAAEELKREGTLLYVGDGINDAPVMASADCAVSMGKFGSAAAVEASDLVLLSDNLAVLPKAIRVARRTRAIVMQNIVFSIAMKIVFMALGVMGVLPLWLAVFADVGVMLAAVLNSFRVRRK